MTDGCIEPRHKGERLRSSGQSETVPRTSASSTKTTSLDTMGVSFSAGTSPTVGKRSFELGADEMELGLCIHDEPGVTPTQLQSADQLRETLLTEILKQGASGNGRRVIAMINNFGASTEMELAIVARHALAFLERNRFSVERIYAGTFLSSLDMAGISRRFNRGSVKKVPTWRNAANIVSRESIC